jgi:hypothetical integral membrane protein (TIGR02206 family)
MIEHYVVPLFSNLWWIGLLFSALFIALPILIVRNKPEQYQLKFGFWLGVFLLMLSLSIHPYMALKGKWVLQSSLPLQLCSMSALLSGFIFFYRSQILFECLLYWGLAGAIHSILTPEMSLGNDTFLIFEYYAAHAGIILSALFLAIIHGEKPRKHSWLRVFGITQVVIILIGGVNYLLDSNYMYLCKKPAVDNPFVIGDWPFYVIVLEIVGLVHFFIVYQGFKFFKHVQPEPAK